MTYNVIGMMSGTSLDGLDMVCCEFINSQGIWNYRIIRGKTLKYPPELLKRIKESLGVSNLEECKILHKDLGDWFALSLEKFINQNSLKVDLIASHGQTIYHNPDLKKTIQLGDGQRIADRLKCTVVADFRFEDVLKGGQGAPLVPIGDLHLFPEYKYCLNLGGIANISIKNDGMIKAFDICICNTGANFFAGEEGFDMDRDGAIGLKGSLNNELLDKWNSMAFQKKNAPKSLDTSFFYQTMLPLIEELSFISPADKLHTLYHFIATQVYNVVQNDDSRILITGGGAHNKFLVSKISELNLNIHVPDRELVDYKEALIFAFMGLLRSQNINNVLASVTGATEDHSAGTIYISG